VTTLLQDGDVVAASCGGAVTARRIAEEVDPDLPILSLTRHPDNDVMALGRSSALKLGSSAELPADARIVSGGRGWTSSAGEPIRVWLFSSGTQAAMAPS